MTPEQVMAHLKARGAFIDLPTACHTGDIERVRELLRQDPTLANKLSAYQGYYLGAGAPLSNAAAAGRMDIVRLLLDHGADPNLAEEQVAPKGKALYSAVHQGHYDIAKLLLERGAFPNPPVESSGDALWISREWRPDKRMEQLLLSSRRHADERTFRGRLAGAVTQLAAHHPAPPGSAQGRSERSERADRRRCRSDGARRAPPIDAARLGGEVWSAGDGDVPARPRRGEEPS